MVLELKAVGEDDKLNLIFEFDRCNPLKRTIICLYLML